MNDVPKKMCSSTMTQVHVNRILSFVVLVLQNINKFENTHSTCYRRISFFCGWYSPYSTESPTHRQIHWTVTNHTLFFVAFDLLSLICFHFVLNSDLFFWKFQENKLGHNSKSLAYFAHLIQLLPNGVNLFSKKKHASKFIQVFNCSADRPPPGCVII